MSAAVVELHVGGRVWFEGSMYLVQELGPQRTTLAADGRLRSVSTAEVVRHATLISDDTDTDAGDQTTEGEPLNVLLSGLTKTQRATLEGRAELVRGVLSPALEDARSMKQRCDDAAAEHGVSSRTVQRWISGYRRAGLAGLADSRMLNRYAPSVDPRWDTACLAVLTEFTARSTPTKNVVLDRIRRPGGGGTWFRAGPDAVASDRLPATGGTVEGAARACQISHRPVRRARWLRGRACCHPAVLQRAD